MNALLDRWAIGLVVLLAACASPAASASPSSAASLDASPTAEGSVALPALDAFPDGFATDYVSLGQPPHKEGDLLSETLDFWEIGGSFPVGSGVLTFTEARETGAAVTCGGVEHQDPDLDVSDQSDPKGQVVGTIGVASILLQPDHQVGVFPAGGDTEPTCWEQTGSYTVTFATGPNPGVKTGTYLLTLDRLTLD